MTTMRYSRTARPSTAAVGRSTHERAAPSYLPPGELTAFLHDIHDAARADAGIDAASVRDPSLADAAAAIAVGGVSRTLYLAVENGQGSETSAPVTTFGTTIRGTAAIVAPAGGTWEVAITDVASGKTLLRERGWTAFSPVSFSYPTGALTRLQVSARWSEGGHTVLELLLETEAQPSAGSSLPNP